MNTPINPSMGPREWSMLIGLSILWGGSFFFVEIVLDDWPPFSIVLSRVLLAALALWVYVFATGRRLPAKPSIWLAFVIMGLINNAIPFSLIVWGQTQITSGLASILNATTPIFTVLVAGYCLADERISARKVIGAMLGFAGVSVMIGPAALRELGAQVLAQCAILGAALSYACASVYGRRFRALAIDPVAVATGQVTASTLMLLPVVLWFERPFELTAPDGYGIAALLGLGLLSTGLAYILFFRLLAAAGALNITLVALLIPVSAILLGTLVLGEVLAAQQFAGMALIGLGLLAIDGRPWRRLRGLAPGRESA